MTKLLESFPNKLTEDITHGEGIYLISKRRRILDASSGVTAHSILGYSQDSIIYAIKEQANKICHLDYKYFRDPQREELADVLLSKKKHNLDRVYFVGSSGGEACEAAMKLSYQAHFNAGEKSKKYFLSREQSYHGSTSDTLSLGDRPNLNFFKPMLPEGRFKVPEHNEYRHRKIGESAEEYSIRSVEDIENRINEIGAEKICGFVAETTMGGLVGDVPPTKNYWKLVRNICNKYNIHLIIDEVWCGTGTSGKVYSIDYDEVTPDFIFLGKTLGAGYAPVSAVVTSSNIEKILKKRDGVIKHSTTHQGHCLGVAAALAAQKIIHDDTLLTSVKKNEKVFKTIIRESLSKQSSFFKNVRGRGLRISIEYSCKEMHKFGCTLAKRILDKHNILLSGKWHRISITPPLIIEEKQIQYIAQIIAFEFLNLENEWENVLKNDVRELVFF